MAVYHYKGLLQMTRKRTPALSLCTAQKERAKRFKTMQSTAEHIHADDQMDFSTITLKKGFVDQRLSTSFFLFTL